MKYSFFASFPHKSQVAIGWSIVFTATNGVVAKYLSIIELVVLSKATTMVRPGPRTTQEEVKTAVVRLLQQYSEGLNFNQIFKELKQWKVLGSFSVLSRALKDLTNAGITKYEDAQVSAYKIPKRVYKLTAPMEHELRQLILEAKRKEAIPLEKIVSKEELLDHLFRAHTNALISIYRVIFADQHPLDENTMWRLMLKLELKYIETFMETVATAVSQNKIPIEEAQEVAWKVHQRIWS
jgi:DNA-binding HxlR family transcriptional regulator